MLKLRFKFSPQTMFHLKIHEWAYTIVRQKEEDDNTGVRVFSAKRYRAVRCVFCRDFLLTLIGFSLVFNKKGTIKGR